MAKETEKETREEVTNEVIIDQHYIALVVADKLDKKLAEKWYRIVRDIGPKGIVTTIQQTDPDGNPRNVKMIRKDYKKTQKYVIPLTRSLTDNECEDIVMVWSEIFPEDQDFNIETDNPFTVGFDLSAFEDDSPEFTEAEIATARIIHNDWVEQMQEDGWRYGPKISYDEKMHPLLLPWEQLPNDHKTPRKGLLDKILSSIS